MDNNKLIIELLRQFEHYYRQLQFWIESYKRWNNADDLIVAAQNYSYMNQAANTLFLLDIKAPKKAIEGLSIKLFPYEYKGDNNND